MNTIRSRFPIYKAHPALVYLDSAATALKVDVSLHAMEAYYTSYSANVHRGMYPLAQQADEAFTKARNQIANFIHAQSADEIVFTKGATEGFNLLATTISNHLLHAGGEIVTTIMEHHANFVPWQQVALQKSLPFGVVLIDPLNMHTEQILDIFKNSITAQTSVLTLTHISNVTGSVLPVREIVTLARTINPSVIIVLDICQSIPHITIDVQDMDVDFAVFSGHKCFGPTGIGVIYGRRSLLESLPPYQYGGDMIHEVHIEHTTFADIPSKFEAGTPPIAQAIGLGVALEFMQQHISPELHAHVAHLRKYCIDSLAERFPRDIIVHSAKHLDSCAIVCFSLRHIHPHDIAQVLGEQGICIRAGHHCAQPFHTHLGISSSCRLSISIYNTVEDIDQCMAGLQQSIVQLS